LLFERGEELPGILGRLQRGAELRARLAANAYASFQTHWTEEAVVPRYLELIAEVAARKGRSDVAERLMRESAA
ncbi:MAG: hypothetical protein ACRELX_07565, partial [Longimicrobiales bacterium]